MSKVEVKANIYKILERAVEAGIAYGWNHAHKHSDTPGEEKIKEELERAVMSEICKVVKME